MEDMSPFGTFVFYPLFLLLPCVWSLTKDVTKDFIGEMLNQYLPNWNFNMETYSKVVRVVAFLCAIVFCLSYCIFTWHFADQAGMAIVNVFRNTPWYVTAILFAGFIMRWYAKRLEATRRGKNI